MMKKHVGGKVERAGKYLVLRLSFLALAFLFFTACGDDGANNSISGVVSKGPVSGATVTVYAVNPDGSLGAELASAVTDTDGSYSLTIGSYSGSVVVKATGGTYVDEATGAVVGNGELKAAATGVGAEKTIHVTPLTETAVQIAGKLTDANIEAANILISNMIGGIDILVTKPANVTDASSSTAPAGERDYGLMLAAFSQSANDIYGGDVVKVISDLAADLSDGILDLTGADLSTSLGNLMDGGNNMTGIPSSYPDFFLENMIAAYSAEAIPAGGFTAYRALLTDVEFTDPNLEACVLAEGANYGVIYVDELTILRCQYKNIIDLTGLSVLSFLENLSLSYNNISDISQLVSLRNVNTLGLARNNTSDLSALSEMSSLRTAWLYDNNITDLRPLAGLTQLGFLHLANNDITDVSPLAGLANLTGLEIWMNNISDISPLAELENLVLLALWINNISDVSPLAGLTGLKTLYLDHNMISDLNPLSQLTALEKLALYNNQISDVTPLAGLTNLISLRLENIPPGSWGDQVNDITTGVAGLVTLTNAVEIKMGGNLNIPCPDLDTLTAALPGVVSYSGCI